MGSVDATRGVNAFMISWTIDIDHGSGESRSGRAVWRAQRSDSRSLAISRTAGNTSVPVEDVSTMFWAIGAHFGCGVSRSARGDRMVRSGDIWEALKTVAGTAPESAQGRTIAQLCRSTSRRTHGRWC